MRATTIDTGWTVTAVDAVDAVPDAVRAAVVPAVVPGCVHTDLLAAGLIPDPYLDRNEELLAWIGDTTWRYETTVELTADRLRASDRHELCFDGLDTIAEITVNGIEVARTENMHRRYVVDVTTVLQAGPNELAVTFTPVREYTDRVRAEVGEFPASYPQPFNYVRKMASNFGWDWGPILVTAGIWKPVTLRSWSTARLDSVRPQLSYTERGGSHAGRVVVDVDLELTAARGDVLDAIPSDAAASAAGPSPGAGPDVEVSIAGVVRSARPTAGSSSVRVELEVPEVELWWPREWGEPHRYELTVTLRHDGAPVDEWHEQVGFRSVALHTRPDADGESFELEVNGRPLFVRGVNWIPDDCFVARVDRADYVERLTSTVEANVNLVRVWGGGLYERHEFYQTCDELGLLVWQDFATACAAYPEVEPLRGEIIAEARDNVIRLMPHPSLILWNGTNESIWGHADWGWEPVLGDKPWGFGYYDELLPGIVGELDPQRVYWPGSPYSGSPDIAPNDPAYGTTHFWEVWNDLDYTTYASYRPRFVGEFGFQGPANWATLERAVGERPLRHDSATFLAHQKAEDGDRKLADGMAPHLPAPRGRDGAEQMDDWHYLTQLNQARAVEFGIRHFRALSPLCRGAIVWQINDCWPVTSWAAIDGDGRLKPLWYALRRVYRPVLVTIDATTGDGIAVAVVNDSPDDVSGELVVERLDVDGVVQARMVVPVAATAGSTARVELTADLAQPGSPARELLRAAFDGATDLRCFTEDVDAELPPARFEARTAPVEGGLALTVTAGTMLRDLVVAADRVDPAAIVDDQLVTVLPGESHTFVIRTGASPDDPRWHGAPVIRCVNDMIG
ncbi:MAG: glycoside hydrolase family 2 protein [Phycicoccus sp.]